MKTIDYKVNLHSFIEKFQSTIKQLETFESNISAVCLPVGRLEFGFNLSHPTDESINICTCWQAMVSKSVDEVCRLDFNAGDLFSIFCNKEIRWVNILRANLIAFYFN